MIPHVVICEDASDGDDDELIGRRARTLRAGIEHHGVGYFVQRRKRAKSFRLFKERLLDPAEQLRWTSLLDDGLVRVRDNAPTSIRDSDTLAGLRESFCEDDLVVCGDAQARDQLGLGPELFATGRPTVCGLGGLAEVATFENAQDSWPRSLNGNEARDLVMSVGFRRLMALSDEVAIADRYLTSDAAVDSLNGFQWLLERLDDEVRTRDRRLTILTQAPEHLRWDDDHQPDVEVAETIVALLGLQHDHAGLGDCTLFVLPYHACRERFHDRHLKIGGRVFDIGRGATLFGPVSRDSTLHHGSRHGFERLMGWAEQTVEWRIVRKQGQWRLEKKGLARPVVKFT